MTAPAATRRSEADRGAAAAVDSPRLARLRFHLDALLAVFGRTYVDTDPVRHVHAHGDARDREVVAFFAAGLAFGSVAQIQASVARFLGAIGPHPARTLRGASLARLRRRLATVRHRFLAPDDLALGAYLVGEMLRREGSIERFFVAGGVPARSGLAGALASFSERALALAPAGSLPCRRPRDPVGARFLFPSPVAGSACKRLNLFLRWVVRPADGVDLGLWSSVPRRILVLPLDTHVFRIGRRIGLSRRRTPDWKTAEAMTATLRRLDPEDPVKYDFSLSRLGILRIGSGSGPARCSTACPVDPVCRL